jgi:hypothetical protein
MSTTMEFRPCKYIRCIKIPQQHIPLFATWSQVTTNYAKARLMQQESNWHWTLQSTYQRTWSTPVRLHICSYCSCMDARVYLVP